MRICGFAPAAAVRRYQYTTSSSAMNACRRSESIFFQVTAAGLTILEDRRVTRVVLVQSG